MRTYALAFVASIFSIGCSCGPEDGTCDTTADCPNPDDYYCGTIPGFPYRRVCLENNGSPDGGPPPDAAAAAGFTVSFADEPVLLDHGVTFFNPTEPVLLEGYLWSWDTGCEAAMMGTPAQDLAQMFMIVRGAGGLRPVAASYPVVSHVSPVDPGTATLSFNLSPSGSLRGVSGTVVIDSIDGDDNVTVVVDALLEDGTAVRGRATLGMACR